MGTGCRDDWVSTSRYLAYLLRHHPEAASLEMDDHGWVDVEALIAEAVADGRMLDRDILDSIVECDSKQRFVFSADGSMIRAQQGHSVDVDVDLKEREPPEILYHGTAVRFVESIDEVGLVSGNRLYVHLSDDAETARSVGARHGRPFVYRVLAGEMACDGYQFFLSGNGVWLVEEVPPEYLEADL